MSGLTKSETKSKFRTLWLAIILKSRYDVITPPRRVVRFGEIWQTDVEAHCADDNKAKVETGGSTLIWRPKPAIVFKTGYSWVSTVIEVDKSSSWR